MRLLLILASDRLSLPPHSKYQRIKLRTESRVPTVVPTVLKWTGLKEMGQGVFVLQLIENTQVIQPKNQKQAKSKFLGRNSFNSLSDTTLKSRHNKSQRHKPPKVSVQALPLQVGFIVKQPVEMQIPRPHPRPLSCAVTGGCLNFFFFLVLQSF